MAARKLRLPPDVDVDPRLIAALEDYLPLLNRLVRQGVTTLAQAQALSNQALFAHHGLSAYHIKQFRARIAHAPEHRQPCRHCQGTGFLDDWLPTQQEFAAAEAARQRESRQRQRESWPDPID